MKNLLLAGLLALGAAGQAQAAAVGCIDTAGGLVLEKPRFFATGPQYTGCIDRTFDILSASAAVLGAGSTIYAQGSLFDTIGALSADTIAIGSGTVHIGTTTFLGAITGLVNDPLIAVMGVSTGALAVSTGALELAKVDRAGDTMTGQLTISTEAAGPLTMESEDFNGQFTADCRDMENFNCGLAVQAANGSFETPTGVLADQQLGVWTLRAHDGTDFTGVKAKLSVSAQGDWSGANNGTYWATHSAPEGSTSRNETFRVTAAGRLGHRSAGDESNAAVRPLSDTDTGIFYPGADIWAITTGGTEQLRVDSGGALVLASSVTLRYTEETAVRNSLRVGITPEGIGTGRLDLTVFPSGVASTSTLVHRVEMTVLACDPNINTACETDGPQIKMRLDGRVANRFGLITSFNTRLDQNGVACAETKIQGNFSATTSIDLDACNDGGEGNEIRLRAANIETKSDVFQIRDTDGTPRLYKDASGNFGFGTTVPNNLVEIFGGGLTVPALGVEADPEYTFSGGAGTGMYSPVAGEIAFATLAAEAMRIIGTGNVGISTAIPQTTLEVEGNISWGTGPTKATGTAAGALDMAAPLTLIGPTGNLISAASVTASAFFGSGEGITNIAGANVTGDISGNAGTATAFAANGDNCTSGQAPLGVNAAGAVEGCFTPTGAGDTLADADEIITGDWFFASTPSASGISFNDSSDASLLDTPQGTMWALSVDGATQSSGCLVHVFFNSQGADAVPVVTSTTTSSLNMRNKLTGVLVQSCVPGDRCLVGVEGIYRVQLDGAALGASFFVETSATRCRVLQLGGVADSRVVGKSLHSGGAGANTFIWMRIQTSRG